MKNKYFIALIALVSGMMSSCDLTVKEPIGLLVEGQEPSYNVVIASVNSSYEMLSSKLNIIGNWAWDDGTITRNDFLLEDIASDDATKKWSPDGDQAWMDEVDHFNFTSSNGAFNGIWLYDYEGISRCNTAIGLLTDEQVIQSINMESAVRDQLLGESYFLRAFYYFNLVNHFGDVPLILDPVTSFEEAYAVSKRTPSEDIWAQISSDLLESKSRLPKTKYLSSEEPWKVSYGAVTALQAKVALYRQDWGSVVSLVDEVTSIGFALNDHYFDCFDVNKEYSDLENIFTYDHQEKIQPAKGNGLCALLGWGFLAPTSDFINEFEVDDPRLLYTVDVDNRWINKILGTTDGTYNGYDDSPSNKVYIRYADVLLWKAEAALELGNYADAIGIINQIRTRARNTPAPDGSVAPAGTLADRDVSSTDPLEIKAWLIHERRVELGFEAERFSDLKRWKIAKEVLGAKNINFQDHNYLFPIPQNDIDKTAGQITQNPGY